MFEELQAAMDAGTTEAVRMWMNWMGLVFLASVAFVWKHKQARWALATLFGTMIGGTLLWLAVKNVHLLGIVHLAIWLPLAIYLWKTVLSGSARETSGQHKIFFVWVILLFATIVISLVFDVRDIYLVLTGAK
ncbi:MAG: hypothetical protein ABJG15_02865 [Hyphomonadaceae bacterium]